MLPLIQLFAAVIFYIIASLAVFWQPLINKFGSIQWDAVTVHFYNLFFSSETWSKGIFPLWSPYIFAGFPQIADLQVAYFYPINLLISTLTVFTPELIMYQIIIHYFIAGFFAFLFAGYLSKNFWFSIAAGLVYSFGGFMVGHASHVGMQNTATWLPLIFLLLIISLKKTKTFYAALCGLFFGFSILAGHFQTSLYIAFAITFYCIFDIIWNAVSSIKNINKKLLDLILKKIKILSIIFIFAFLVSAVQLLPAYELTKLSNRDKISLEISQTESLNPESLRSLIEPNYNNVAYGEPYLGSWDRTQNYLYLGYAIIILAALGTIIGIFYRDTRKITLFWLSLLIISLFYSFGEFSFLQKYFYQFAPFFDKIRAPANMMFLFNLSIIGIASSFYKNMDNINKKVKDSQEIKTPRSLKNIFYFLKNIFLKNLPLLFGTFALLIISLEILPAIRSNTLLYNREKTDEITVVPPIALRIMEEYSRLDEIDKFRTFRVPAMDRNFTQILHIYAFDGYNPLSLRRHNAYIDAMVKNKSLVDLAAIKYLPCEYIPGQSNELEKIEALCVNKNYYQLAFLIDDFLAVKNETEALEKIQEVNLKKIIVIEETPLKNIDNKNFSEKDSREKSNELSIIESVPGFWHFSVKTDDDVFLFINQTNYPGWIAKIDGIPAKIYQADYLFQSIFVPKGEHEITLKFESKPLIIGVILTIIGISSIVLIILGATLCVKKENS